MRGFAGWLAGNVRASEYTRQEIADHIGVSKAAVDKWMSGDQYPRVVPLFRLCSLLWPSDRDAKFLIATGMIEREALS